MQLHKLPNGSFELKTDKGNMIIAKAVIIAAGCGAFGPNRPPLENLEEFEKTNSVQYMVRKSSDLKDKNVVIAGGGDSAVDWAIILADIAKSITVVHRRPKFRCAPENSDKLAELAKQGKIKLSIPYQLHKLNGQNGHLNSIDIIDLDGNIQNIESDILLPFFGLAMELGPILEWNLDIHKHHILVDQRTLQTNIEGIYAIGDVAHYPGKLKLILNGFAEAAMACHDIYSIVYPDTALHFEYSTTKGIKTL
jgi:thioredoxin reductase (NADPH)